MFSKVQANKVCIGGRQFADAAELNRTKQDRQGLCISSGSSWIDPMCLALWFEACWFLGCQTGICITQTVPQPNLFERL